MNPLVHNIFIRLLGLSYFFAFGSLLVQIKGLIGSNGILPAFEYLQLAQRQGLNAWVKPSVFWFNSSDEFLIGLCASCVVLALYLFIRPQRNKLDLIEFIVLSILCLSYLSFINVSREFLSYQWDILLIETGFLTTLFSLFRRNEFAVKVFTWLFRLLIFKLMFMSGLVKFTSKDPSWASFTALDYHYYTQPIPNPVSYFVHQFPSWFDKLSVIIMLGIELPVALFIFMGRNLRALAGLCFVALMFIVLITGNYCFFNLLTAFICIWLFDDNHLKQVLPEALITKLSPVTTVKASSEIFQNFIEQRLESLNSIDNIENIKRLILRYSLIIFASLIISLDCYFIFVRSPLDAKIKIPAVKLISPWIKPLRHYFISSPYGLFASMTTSRKEIIIQGSSEEGDWKDYDFYYKPQDPQTMPPQVAPFQPRLDWQMWFAALRPMPPPWFVRFAGRLLEGKPEVTSLLKTNPFPEQPPKKIRAVIYDYQFTDLDEQETSKAYWKIMPLGRYLPPIGLK
ncbi:MAG: lipase maturation factor family protein [Candidatus Melainabacteria bacterium]|nr:lipase maturation factor family protein [Candidatus Melainabacteria bacterium]